MNIEYIRAGFINNGENGAGLNFFTKSTANFFFEQLTSGLVELEFALTGSRPAGACAAAVWATHVAVFDTETMELDFGYTAEINVLPRPDGIHDCAIDSSQSIVGHFGIRTGLERWSRRAASSSNRKKCNYR